PDFTCPSLPSLLLFFFFTSYGAPRYLHSFPTRRSSDLTPDAWPFVLVGSQIAVLGVVVALCSPALRAARWPLLAGGGVLMLAGLVMALPPFATDAYPTTYQRPAVPYQAASVAAGAALYARDCAACHGPV